MNRKNRIAAGFLLLLPLAAAAPAEVFNKIVLRVNDRIATLHDYEQRREEAVREITRRDLDPAQRRQALQQVPETVFKDMYEELILQSRADQLGIEVTEPQVDAALANMREGFGIKTDEEFAQALASSGLTQAQIREQLRRNLRMRGVMEQEVWARVDVDEEDLRRYYSSHVDEFRLPEQVHLREVVVLEESGLAPEARQQLARELQKELAGVLGASGASGAGGTSEVIERHAAEGRTSNVIDLGWVSQGDLDPNLERAGWALAPGAVSEPVAARGGLHLLQVVERRPSRVQTFAEVAEAIGRKERNRVYQEEVAKYMTELQKQALIVPDPPQEAAGFRRLLGTDVPAGDLEVPAPGSAAVPAEVAAPAAPEDVAAPSGDIPQTEPLNSTPPGELPEPKPVDNIPPGAR